MILVIGEPRSGTSLVMQTLVHLGFIPFGTKFPRYRDKSQNTRGFWEHRDSMNNRFHDLEDGDDEMCLKMGLSKFLNNPRIGLGNKLIVCTRPAAQLADAQIATGISENRPRTIARIQNYYQQISDLAAAHPQVPVLQVALGTFRSQPAVTVDMIIAFVSPLPERGRQAAIDNVAGGGE